MLTSRLPQHVCCPENFEDRGEPRTTRGVCVKQEFGADFSHLGATPATRLSASPDFPTKSLHLTRE